MVLIGTLVIGFIVLCALLAPWISPYDPNAQSIVDRLEGPSAEYLLGTDGYGRDILSRILWGARASLLISSVSVLIAMVLGSTLGILAGFYGGRVDRLIMAGMDVLLSFPSLILGLLVVAMIGPEIWNLILAITLTTVAPFARIARGPTLSMRAKDFVEACRALGYSDPRIMVRHILPNIADTILVLASLWLATAIRTEASLSFIGLGLRPPTPTWGGMIREGFENILNAPWLAIFPSLAVLLLMLALNLVGDGLRDATDPRMRNE